jgi:hypothetical protein
LPARLGTQERFNSPRVKDLKRDRCAWQQYSFIVNGNTLCGVINNRPVEWSVADNLVDLILE